MPKSKCLQNKPLDVPAVRVARTILRCLYDTVAELEYAREIRHDWVIAQRQWFTRSRGCRTLPQIRESNGTMRSRNCVTLTSALSGKSCVIDLASTFGQLC